MRRKGFRCDAPVCRFPVQSTVTVTETNGGEDVDATSSMTAARLRRLLFLAVFAGMAWCVLSLASSAESASANEGDASGSGLLGTVGSVVNGVGGAVSDTTGVVDQTLTSAVDVVAPVAEAVPVVAPVASTVREVASEVDAVVQETDTVVRDTVDATTGTVTDVAQSGIVSTVVHPVVDVVTEVPVAGTLLTQTGLADTVDTVATGVDATVSTVVGTAAPAEGIFPELPVSALDPLSPPTVVDESPGPGTDISTGDHATPVTLEIAVSTWEIAAPTVIETGAALATSGRVATSAPSSSLATLSAAADVSAAALGGADSVDGGDIPWPGGGSTGLVAGGGASATGGSSATGSAATSPEPAQSRGIAFTSFRVHSDDALPGAPVFDTDVAPD